MRSKFFKFLAHIAACHPRKIVALAVALTVIAGAYAAMTLTLNANLDDLVSERLEYHKRYIDFLEEFGDEEYLYVVADSKGDMPSAKAFLTKLAERLKQVPDLKEIIYRIDNPALERNFLLYMTPDQLKGLRAMVSQGPFAVRRISSWKGMDQLFAALADRIAGPVSTEDEAELAQGFTFIDGLIDDMDAAVTKGAAYKSRLQELFFGDGDTFDTDGFYRNGDLFFLLIMPAKDFSTMEVIERPLREIRAAIDQTSAEFPGLDAGLTGRPVLSADEIMTSNRDMNWATAAAIVLVAIAMVFFFRGAARPLLAVAALIMGIAWTFGFVALIYGTLNLLSVVFAIILVGATIEYAIHVVARYEEQLAVDGRPADAMARALSLVGPADMTSALTTAAAFLTITWTDMTALVQLGVIASVGIVLCLAAMLCVLPAMLIMRDSRRPAEELGKIRPFVMPGLASIYRRPVLLFAVACAITAAAVPLALRVGFDNNLLNLQAKGLESVRFERLIIDKSSETTWFARAVAGTIEESHRMAREFAKLPSVRGVDDVERILPEGQKEKIAAVGRMAPAFQGVAFTEPSAEVDQGRLMFELGRLAGGLERLQEDAFGAGRVDAVEELETFAAKIRRLVADIGAAGTQGLANLGAFQKQFFADIRKNMEILATGMDPVTIALSDLPPDLVGRFVSPRGRYALFIYPSENIWDPDALARFVNDIRSVEAGVTGTPIEVHESGKLMRDTFARSAVLAFLVICLLVWLDFRSLRASLLAVMPLAVGVAWMVGIMGLAGIPFNMANFFAIPIIIGIGVDFGVQVVHRFRQERSFAALGTATGKAVILTAIANGVGFGTMAFAHHQGIASLGLIMAAGCTCCLAAVLIAMPPVAKWLNWGRKAVTRNS